MAPGLAAEGTRMAKAKIDRLIGKTYALADQFPIMPIEEIRLSVAFAELPNPQQVVRRLLADLVDHDDMHVRRVGINACRRIGLFQIPGLRDAIVRRLSDPAHWVQYDAVWTVQAAGYDGPDVRRLLGRLAAGVHLPEDEERLKAGPSNAELAARVRARVALDKLLGTNTPPDT
jgi:hypothetical protein